MTDTNNPIEIFTDGACRGNPGPGGWGALLRSGSREKSLYGGERDTTNNRMELTAAIEGLKALKRPCKVVLTTDSQYVRKGITEWMSNWKKKGWKTAAKKPVKNADLWRALDELSQQHDIDWRWVKGHSGHRENEIADALANQGIDELNQQRFNTGLCRVTTRKEMSRQIVLDTETTGLEPSQGHRIIEIGCVEMVNRRLTGRHFHQYINPQREVEAGAIEVHGITNEMLADKPVFADVAGPFLEFVKGAELVIHNAPFDVGFLDAELSQLGSDLPRINEICSVLDTLVMARQKHPGQRNSLDALCQRYDVDNSQRDLHGALLDAEILADVYLMMTGGQTNLALAGDDHGDRSGGQQSQEGFRRLAAERPALAVIRASDEELSAHEAQLQIIDKASGGQCLWRSAVGNDVIEQQFFCSKYDTNPILSSINESGACIVSIRVDINTSSFALVADELNNTVQQATNVFETFLAERHGLHLLEECEQALRQIGGTLRLIEVRGAALLADEMRSLCQAIVGNTDALPDAQLNALSTAFFVLPRYLEFVQSQGADIPLLALGHANDLRAAHQQLLLPDSYFSRDDGWLFSRDANLRLRNEPLGGDALQDIYKRTRHMYQRGLLGLLKGGQEELQLMMMTRALQRLCRHIPPGPSQRFWLLANGVVEAFSREGLKVTTQRRRVLASLEGQLRAAVLGRFNINEVLEKELIFLLSLSSYKEGFTGRIQHAAKIRSADLDDAELSRLQQQMLGLSYDTVSSVLGELRVELRHAKDILELLAQHGRSDAEEIQPLSSLLQQCADVLLVLNLTGLAATLNEHVAILNKAIGSDLEQHRDDLENLAENLLFIESGLAQIDRRKLNYDELASLSFDQRDAVNTDNIVSEAKSLVVDEAKSIVALAKRALAAYIESGFDIMQITNLPSNFDAVRGAFELIGTTRLAAVLASSRDFMKAYLQRTEDGDEGDARAVETLADAMISIEYYLSELERRFIANDDILLVAEDSLQQLGFPVQREATGQAYGTA